jgi:DNA-binding transcriptional LysR family regulator
MELRRLRTFVTVAELGTVSRAALHLHIAQPALSRQLSDLEQELGLTLFDRVGRRLFLTGAGEQLLGSCRSLLGSVSALSEQAQLLQRGDNGVLKVAASPVQIETVFSTFLHQYALRYPNVQVKLTEAVGSRTLALLERGEIHLGVSLLQSIHADDRHFGIYPVPAVELLAACHPSFQLKSGSTIDISSIALHPLLLLESGFVVRKTFDTICRLVRIKPNILLESGVPHNLLAFAEAGLGIAVIPSVVQTHRYALRVARITHERKPIREPLAVVWDKRRVLPHYVQDFCETLATHMRGLSSMAQRSAPKLDDRKMHRGGPSGGLTIKRRGRNGPSRVP